MIAVLFTGRMIDAATAKDMGLVSRVVAPEALLSTAHELASEMYNHNAIYRCL